LPEVVLTNNNFTSVTGTYGTLKVGADGTYTYVADQSAADDLDLNDTATDSFTYTISDGTDTATQLQELRCYSLMKQIQ
jgi:VCBS repeat-containing protein